MEKNEEAELYGVVLDELLVFFAGCGIVTPEEGFRKAPHTIYAALRDLKKMGAAEVQQQLRDFITELRRTVDSMTMDSVGREIFENFVNGVENVLQNPPPENLIDALHQCNANLAIKNEVILKQHTEIIVLREQLAKVIHLLTSMASAAKTYDVETFPDGELVLYDVQCLRRADNILKQLLSVPVEKQEFPMSTHEFAWKLLGGPNVPIESVVSEEFSQRSSKLELYYEYGKCHIDAG